MTATMTSLLTAAVALAGVLGLILLIGRLARSRTLGVRVGGAGTLLVVRQSLAVDQRRRLHLLECDGHSVLLVTGGPNDVALTLRANAT